MDNVTEWSRLYVAAWAAWAILFVALELWALRNDNDSAPPLTHVVARWVPAAITIPFLAWLLWHGIATYSS